MAKNASKKGTKKPVKKVATKTQKPATKKAVHQAVSAATSAFGVTPLGDRVLVRPLESVEETTASGFIIPDSAKKEKAERGVVVAVGAGRRNDAGDIAPIAVAIGDTVMFSKYGFEEITLGDVTYYLVSEPSILAIVR